MQKKLAIISGISSGIGKSLALELASDEYLILGLAKSNQEGLDDTINKIRTDGYEAYGYLCDVSNPDAVAGLKWTINEIGLPVKLLINNAGISLVKLFTETSYEDWTNIIASNLTSVYNLSSLVVPYMIRNQDGYILNISSIWGNEGASMEVAYSASKGGVNSFTKALAKELGPSGIQVNAIACGVIDTPMNSFLSHEDRLALKEEISLGRFARPQEVAQFAKALIHSASYLNGQIITYDGGM